MALLKQNEQQYYIGRKEFDGDGATTIFTVTEIQDAFHSSLDIPGGTDNNRVRLFIDEALYPQHFATGS